MAIAFVNSATGTGDATAGSIATSAANHTTGNLLVVGVEYGNEGGNTVSGVADTAGNTYSSRPVLTDGTFGNHLQVWYALNITGNASNVVTATFTGTPSFRRIIALQYSGAATVNAFDVDITGASGSGTTLTSGSFTPSEANEVGVVFVSNDDGTTTTFTSGTYTVRVSQVSNDTGAGDKIGLAVSAQTAVFTASVSSSWRIVGATFKQASGGGGGGPAFNMCPGNGYFWRYR